MSAITEPDATGQAVGDIAARVYIVLVNWHGAADTEACLDSLRALTHRDHRIVVCDNGSADGSVPRLRAWMAGQRGMAGGPDGFAEYARAQAEAGGVREVDAAYVLVRNEANLGFAGGCNVGLRYAMARGDADFVWLLNNDTVVTPDALGELLAVARRRPDAGMVGSTLCFLDARDKVQALGGGLFDADKALTFELGYGGPLRALSAEEVREVERRMAYVVGASMLVSRRLLSEVGLMQEDYFLYFEELDWAERARRADPPLGLAYAPRSMVYHKVGGAIGVYERSLASVRHYTRSRLRFVQRFYPRHERAARRRLLREGIGALLRGRLEPARVILATALRPGRV